MKILVTGVGGFIGTYVADYLAERGHEVIGVIRTPRDFNPDYKTIVYDISKCFDFKESVETIIHIAGSLPYNTGSFAKYKSGNVDTTEHLISYAKKMGINNFIYLSTIGIYGEFITDTVTEKTKVYNPDGYGITKYFAENLLKSESMINSICLRVPGVLGKGTRGVWLANLAEKMINGEKITIYTPEFQTTNFVHVHDLAKFINKLICEGIPEDKELLLACHQPETIKNIVSKMKELLNSNSEIAVDNLLRRPFRLDAKRAFELGYESMTPIEIVERYCEDININFCQSRFYDKATGLEKNLRNENHGSLC